MGLLAAMIRNHPLANIAFAVVIVLGMLAFAGMPREQDPEINFNWVNISTALPGARAADVEDRVTNPLEDALRRVQDIRFVASSSREGVSNILVLFRDMPVRVFDKRVNDLRREVQNTYSAELPAEAIDPVVLEITTSNGFPTAMVLLTGQAADETLRYAAREIQNDLERIAGVDRVMALGFHEPELQVEFDPEALTARGANADQLADGLRGWFRDVFAGKIKTRGDEWLVRVDGGVWPRCSNLLADPTDVGSFVVTYQAGYPVPAGTGLITSLLACELALALCQADSCRLPRRVQSMTRQGVTISFSDLDDGRTGLPEVDMWVSAQRRPPRRATVWSPDVVVPRQTTWQAGGTSP